MRMADSFRMATLLPAAAMRPRRPAEPVSWVRMVEKVSDWGEVYHVSDSVILGDGETPWVDKGAYRVVDDILGPRVVVDVDGDAAQGADLG